MNLKNLIIKYLPSSYDKSEVTAYILRKKIDIEIPEKIVKCIKKLNCNTLLAEQDFLDLSNELSRLDIEVRDCIIHLLYAIGANKYEQNREKIETFIESIERNLKEGRGIPKTPGKSAQFFLLKIIILTKRKGLP